MLTGKPPARLTVIIFLLNALLTALTFHLLHKLKERETAAKVIHIPTLTQMLWRVPPTTVLPRLTSMALSIITVRYLLILNLPQPLPSILILFIRGALLLSR